MRKLCGGYEDAKISVQLLICDTPLLSHIKKSKFRHYISMALFYTPATVLY
jgi:hypothetical protein